MSTLCHAATSFCSPACACLHATRALAAAPGARHARQHLGLPGSASGLRPSYVDTGAAVQAGAVERSALGPDADGAVRGAGGQHRPVEAVEVRERDDGARRHGRQRRRARVDRLAGARVVAVEVRGRLFAAGPRVEDVHEAKRVRCRDGVLCGVDQDRRRAL